MANPKISIITPCYNGGYFLPETIDSVLEQTYQDYEVIIIDDGSNDGTTPAIIAEQAKRDKRIRVITHPENKNLPTARNTGIAAAKGKYIVALDSDDLIHPTFLEKSVALAIKEDANLVYCHRRLFGTKNKILYMPKTVEKMRRRMAFQSLFNVCSLYKKSDWKEFGGYDETMPAYEDWDFWLHFVKHDKKLVLLDEVLHSYRIHKNSMSRYIGKASTDLKRRIRKKHPEVYQFHNYYFTFRFFRLALREFRRFFIQIRIKDNYKKFRLLGITFYEKRL